MRKRYKCKLSGTEDEIADLIRTGTAYAEIARIYDVDSKVVQYFCKSRGFVLTEEQKLNNRGHENVQRIVDFIDNGMTAKDICNTTGTKLNTVYAIARRSGRSFHNGVGMLPVLHGREDEVRKLIEEGETYTAIGKRYGIEKQTVRSFCRKNGFERTAEQKQKNIAKPQDVSEVIRKVFESPNNVEYISGYTGSQSLITVRCKTCGHEFEARYDVIVYMKKLCPACKAKAQTEANEAKAIAEAKRIAEREQREAERARAKATGKAEAERKRIAKIHPCPVCGETTSRPIYCSDRCARKAGNKSHETKRRLKIKSALVDRDITLEGLYKRDSGRCHICGLQCNWEDYTTREGTVLVGDWYPSIDHVIPLSKGGKHAWSNVKLAHMRCNSWKSDKV